MTNTTASVEIDYRLHPPAQSSTASYSTADAVVVPLETTTDTPIAAGLPSDASQQRRKSHLLALASSMDAGRARMNEILTAWKDAVGKEEEWGSKVDEVVLEEDEDADSAEEDDRDEE